MLFSTFSSKKVLALAIAATTFSSIATQAASINPGSWTRGDANSLYAEWDVFNATTDNSADIGTANLASGVVAETTGGAFISGGNIYAFGGGVNPGIWTVSVAGNGAGPVVGDNASVYLQITSRGTALDIASVKLGGVNAASSTLLSSIALGGFGGNEDTWLFSWSTAGVANWNFDFAATGAHMSLAALAVDINTVPAASEVPVPAAAWLFGSGMIGLISVARRRKL
jgi:hypothetical protein